MYKYVLVAFFLVVATTETPAQNNFWFVDKVLDDPTGQGFQVREFSAMNGWHLVWSSELGGWQDIAIGDADNDGAEELVLSSYHQITVYQPDCTRLSFDIPPPRVVKEVLVNDADNDGTNELLVHHHPSSFPESTYVYKYLQGTYQFQKSFANPGNCQHLEIGDADNDGKNELLFGATDSVVILSYVAGTGRYTTKYNIPSKEINDVAIAADVDNDGRNEVLSGGNFGSVRIWRIQGGTAVRSGEQSVWGFSQGVKVGDVNADGNNELVVSATYATYIYSVSNGIFTDQWHSTSTVGSGTASIEIGDGDNDGKNELVIWGSGTPTTRLLKFEGSRYNTLVSGWASKSAVIGRFDLSSYTGVVEDNNPESPMQYALSQNYPNPFNPTTTVQYALPECSHVNLTVYNPLGQQVAALVNGEIDAGYHSVQFDGSGLASGVYFYRLQAGDFVQTKKLLLMK